MTSEKQSNRIDDQRGLREGGASYTVLVLRQGGSRFRKLHLPRLPVLLGGSLAALLVLAGLFVPQLALRVRSQTVELERLQQENRRLWNERDRFEGALAEMGSHVDMVEEEARRLAREMGVDRLPTLEAPAGGSEPQLDGMGQYWFDGEIRAMQSRADRLDRSVEHLDEAFRERIRQLSATPDMLPVEGWFSHGFGWRSNPWTGEREFHKGLDIVAESGSPILAPADGVVTRASRWGNYGKCVEISHGYGFVTRYAHMSEIDVRPGERVERGEPLGKVGSTGRSTGPHLHYEVFRDGRRVNPWKYIGRGSSS
jgi:murein DD-endopeptidase MepM/ murein hydrolase activator NlpD